MERLGQTFREIRALLHGLRRRPGYRHLPLRVNRSGRHKGQNRHTRDPRYPPAGSHSIQYSSHFPFSVSIIPDCLESTIPFRGGPSARICPQKNAPS